MAVPAGNLPLRSILALALGAGVAALAWHGLRPAPVAPPAQGPPHARYYPPQQVRAAERAVGFAVVEPTAAVRRRTGLGLAQVVVTELAGRKAIHYLYGSLHERWVLIMETPQGAGGYVYDPAAHAVFFPARGRGLSVTTNFLSKAALDRLMQDLGGPAPPPTQA
jgi:hypothetical protein